MCILTRLVGRHEAYFRSKAKQAIHLPNANQDVILEDGELLNIEWSYKVGPSFSEQYDLEFPFGLLSANEHHSYLLLEALATLPIRPFTRLRRPDVCCCPAEGPPLTREPTADARRSTHLQRP